MGTHQVYAKAHEEEMLNRLIAYYDNEQEKRFKGKAWLMGRNYRRTRRHSGRTRRIKREKINVTFVYRTGLHALWIEMQNKVVKFEKGK
jgi:hypothetical protein